MEEKTYDLGGKKYIQRPIVLGQFYALLPVLEGIKLDEEMVALEVVKALGGKLSEALAIVLIEEDKDIRQAIKEKGSRAAELECRLPIEMIPEVIEDFFECNRASSIIERLTATLRGIAKQIGPAPEQSGAPQKASNTPSGGSVGEMSPEGNKSSGG